MTTQYNLIQLKIVYINYFWFTDLSTHKYKNTMKIKKEEEKRTTEGCIIRIKMQDLIPHVLVNHNHYSMPGADKKRS